MKNDRSAHIAKLTALWALNEAGLGGLMHALQIPFTGLFVGGFAIILISLIAQSSDHPFRDILRSMVIVLIIKAIVSPHSPPPAYIAVTFQALLSALLYSILPWFRVSAILIGVLTLLESAIQKILVLWLLFGKALPIAVDAFVEDLLKAFHVSFTGSATAVFVWTFIGVYALAGLLIGIWIGRIPNEIATQRKTLQPVIARILQADSPSENNAKKNPWPLIFVVAFTVFILLVPQGKHGFMPGLISIGRAAGILAVWMLLIGPLLTRLIRSYLLKKQTERSEEVAAMLSHVDRLRGTVAPAWKVAGELKQGIGRIRIYVILLLLISLDHTTHETQG